MLSSTTLLGGQKPVVFNCQAFSGGSTKNSLNLPKIVVLMDSPVLVAVTEYIRCFSSQIGFFGANFERGVTSADQNATLRRGTT